MNDRSNDRTMDRRGNPQIYYYLKKYQEEPKSRIFAPLAESYRKAGLIDEAIEIAREGVRHHPRFVGGKVALARALFDRNLYEEVVAELEPLLHDAPDNLIAQRLLAESYLLLNQPINALAAFKMLLFLVPGDSEIAALVQELETRAYTSGDLGLQNEPRLVLNPSPDAIKVKDQPQISQERLAWNWKLKTLQNLLANVTKG